MNALVVRDAAIGDLIMATPVISSLARRGYDVHVACKKYAGDAVLAGNPNVTMAHELDRQESHEARIARINAIASKCKADLVLDLAGTCESRFLFSEGSTGYTKPLSWRRANAKGHNYYNFQAQTVGDHATRGELYVSREEEKWWMRFRSMKLGVRLVQVQLTGSSICKVYPWWPTVIKGLQRDPRVLVILTGDPGLGQILGLGAVEEGCDPTRIWQTCGDPKVSLRSALVMTRFVDLVMGPETGILNAAGCFGVPKVLLLSHSSAENISAGWDNCIALQPEATCSPCYRLVSPGAPCDRVTEEEDPDIAGAARCMATISPERILTAAEILKGKR